MFQVITGRGYFGDWSKDQHDLSSGERAATGSEDSRDGTQNYHTTVIVRCTNNQNFVCTNFKYNL